VSDAVLDTFLLIVALLAAATLGAFYAYFFLGFDDSLREIRRIRRERRERRAPR
jgi:hypothetical protein